jgi:KDO2-lipid IV(A) lauroyltransferase
MAEIKRPPLRAFFGNAEQRRWAIKYWLRDPVVGVINLGIYFTMRLLPIDVGSAIGARLGSFARFRYPQSHARARALWMRLRPDEIDKTDEAVARLWRNVGRTMVEFSVLDRLWKAGRIEVAGVELIRAAHATGRPIIGLGVHLGNWETIGVAMLSLGFRGGSIYEPPENRFDHLIANLARSKLPGKPILARQNAAAEAFILLTRKKQQIVIYGDELARGRVWGPAFGRPLRINGNIGNAVRLARLSNALILPLHCLRLGESAHFRVTVSPPYDLIKTEDRDADVLTNVAAIDALIDPIIRANLDQWFFGLDFEFEDGPAAKAT